MEKARAGPISGKNIKSATAPFFLDSMPELLIDATRLVGRFMKGRSPTGIDRVCLAYVRRYAAVARVVLKRGPFGTILPKAPSQDLFALLLDRSKDFSRRAAHLIAKSIFIPPQRSVRSGSFLLNIGHSGPEQPQYSRWLQRNQMRPIFMVHDLIPVTHPEYCRPSEQARHIRRLDTMLRTAAAVVTNSEATLQALSGYAVGRGLSMPPAAAAPLAAEMSSLDAGPRPLSQPYFVILGTVEPRKNHWMLLQVWRRLIERLGEKAPRLVVIGQRGWECENVIDLLERCNVLRGFVFEKAGCADAELVEYLRYAQALLFPSFVEGYGLPLIEALSLGVPVIASGLPVFHEIAGNIPEYLDPLDGTAWLQRIEAYCHPESLLRTAQLGRIATFTPPTWSAHFEIFENLLGRVA